MEYRTLGRSGCSVSALALGTMTFGAETDEAGAHEQLDRFVEAGGTLVDLADAYSAGAAEEITGRWLASRPADVRDRVVLATKGRFPLAEEPNALGNSRRHLRRALEDSLRRLGVDHVDLYQLHAWDPLTPLEETLRFLADAVSAGTARPHLRRAREYALRVLGVDHVDLYQLDAWDPLTPPEETLRLLDDAGAAGKIG